MGMKKLLILAAVLALAGVGPNPPVAAQETGAGNGHVLNFKDADIRSLIETVADITGRSIIVDPQVAGRVTVISSEPMAAEDLYQVFLSVLRVHGYSAVEGDGVVRVVPDSTARTDAGVPLTAVSAGPDAPITRVVGLRHVEAAEVATLLRQLVPPSAVVVPHPASNSLVISDRTAGVRRIEAIVGRLDAAGDQDLEVISLQHANAAEVVRIANSVYSGDQRRSVVADERTNTVVLSGDPGRRLRLRALISHLDTPLSEEGGSRVIYLRYADAEGLLPVLESLLDESDEGRSTARIRAHTETNALVITAPPAVYRNIQSVVNQLDIRRAQVLVEAIIAEVAADTGRELGIQWQFFESGDSGFFGGTNFQSGGRNILNLSAGLAGEEAGGVLPGRGLNLGYVGGRTNLLGIELVEIGALARALATDANTNVLSTPSVVTMDNQEASINVGQEVPFLSGSFLAEGISTADGQVNPFQTIERREVGVKLNVTPHINEGDMILLGITQEVSSLAPITGAVDLITNKRTISTRVMVPDGAILVLGGLISDDLIDQTERVPGLGRIPLLGELFTYRSSSQVKRNLMVFIRPRILADEQLMRDITGSKYSLIRERQLEQRRGPRTLTREEDMPLLPELYEFLQTPPDER